MTLKRFTTVLRSGWREFTASSERNGSWLRVTAISKLVVLGTSIFLCLYSPYSATATIMTYDVGLNPQMVTLLTMTGNILASGNITAHATQQVQQIQSSRQTVSLLLAQISALQQFGTLLLSNPLGNLIASVKQFMDASGSINTTSPQWAQFVNYYPPYNSLRFNGSNFSGGNGLFVDNMAGLGGLPVANDRQIPMYLVPLSTTANAVLTGARTVYTDLALATGVVQGFNQLFSSTTPVSRNLVANGVMVRQAQPIDNLFINEVQNGSANSTIAFYGLVDGLDTVGYAYNPMSGVTQVRDRVQATNPKLRFNDTNTLSSGCWAAVEEYNAKAVASGDSPVANQYDHYGYRVTPALLASGRIIPGQRISITQEIVDQAAKMGPAYQTNFPNKLAAADVDTLIPRRLNRSNEGLIPVQYVLPNGQSAYGSLYNGQVPSGSIAQQNLWQGIAINPNNIPSSLQGQGIATVLPEIRQTENYLNSVLSNDLMLGSNVSVTGITSQIIDFAQLIVQALYVMRQAVAALRAISSLFSALEGVTQTLTTIDQTLTQTQQYISRYVNDLHAMLNKTQQLLNERQQIVNATNQQLMNTAADRVAFAAQQQYWQPQQQPQVPQLVGH